MDAVVTPFDLSSDGVHLSTGGYNKMADTWAQAIATVISPQGTANPPLIARTTLAEDLAHVDVVFSKPVDDYAVNLVDFSISGGVTVTGAVLDATTKRTVTGNQDVESAPSYDSPDGTNLVAFNGGDSTPNGVLTRTFATTPGQTYQLAFNYGVLSNNNTQRLRTVVKGPTTTLISNISTIQRDGNNSITWAPKSYVFEANSNTTTVTFTDVSTNTASIDLLLDNVRVTAQDTLSLAVTSSPYGGTNVTVTPSDTGGSGNGTTGLIRSYNSGTSVTVTAPAAFSGRPFLTWWKLGVNLPGSAPSITLAVATHQTLDAVFDSLPTATAQSVTVGEDSSKTITLTGSDPDGDSLFFELVSSTSHGLLTGTPPNLTYTPAANYQGPDSVTFTTYDGIEASSPATVSINVEPLDDFTQWLGGFGLAAGAAEDSDQDSISNAVECVIGGNPANFPDSGRLPTATLVTADPDGDLLDDDYLLFTYHRTLAAHTNPAVALRVEWNAALDGPRNNTAGAPGVVTTVDNSLGPDTALVKVHVPYSLSTSGVLFARLRVVVSAP
jgi:hypothetical protein